MYEHSETKKWESTDSLPEDFFRWLDSTVTEIEMEQKKGFTQVANDLGVDQSLLSRWIAGMGPLKQEDIQSLADRFGSVVYTRLGLEPSNDL